MHVYEGIYIYTHIYLLSFHIYQAYSTVPFSVSITELNLGPPPSKGNTQEEHKLGIFREEHPARDQTNYQVW